MSSYSNLLIYVALVICSVLSITSKKLTIAGGVTGGILGVVIFLGFGYTGLAMLAVFFLAGTFATSWKKEEKQKARSAEDKPRRNAGQVLANAGVAAIMAIMALFYPQMSTLFRVMLAAGFAAATSDTLSSELGMVYGKNFYNVLTFRKEEKGLDGIVSLEGILFGVFGAMLIALIYAIGFGFNINFLWITLSGVAGNLFDSLLGATFERKKYIGNDAVNFLNTLFAAVVAWLLITNLTAT